MASSEASTQKALTFEEGWPILQEAINKLIDTLEGVSTHQFTSDEYMKYYSYPLNLFPHWVSVDLAV